MSSRAIHGDRMFHFVVAMIRTLDSLIVPGNSPEYNEAIQEAIRALTVLKRFM